MENAACFGVEAWWPCSCINTREVSVEKEEKREKPRETERDRERPILTTRPLCMQPASGGGHGGRVSVHFLTNYAHRPSKGLRTLGIDQNKTPLGPYGGVGGHGAHVSVSIQGFIHELITSSLRSSYARRKGITMKDKRGNGLTPAQTQPRRGFIQSCRVGNRGFSLSDSILTLSLSCSLCLSFSFSLSDSLSLSASLLS